MITYFYLELNHQRPDHAFPMHCFFLSQLSYLYEKVAVLYISKLQIKEKCKKTS